MQKENKHKIKSTTQMLATTMLILLTYITAAPYIASNNALGFTMEKTTMIVSLDIYLGRSQLTDALLVLLNAITIYMSIEILWVYNLGCFTVEYDYLHWRGKIQYLSSTNLPE
jgi:hypothetical protein